MGFFDQSSFRQKLWEDFFPLLDIVQVFCDLLNVKFNFIYFFIVGKYLRVVKYLLLKDAALRSHIKLHVYFTFSKLKVNLS